MPVATPIPSPRMWARSSSKLLPTTIVVPKMAISRATRNSGVIRSPNTTRAPTVTKIGAVLANKVALATEVSVTDQCQVARSPAKNIPASTSSQTSRRRGRRDSDSFEYVPPFSRAVQANSTGKARNARWNAVAVGPNSLRRTKMGESATSNAPTTRIISPGRAAGKLAMGARELSPRVESDQYSDGLTGASN